MPRFFVSDNQINEDVIVIEGSDVNHIKNVLRYKVGNEIEVASKQKEESYLCKIEQILEDEICCNIIEKIEQSKESKLHLHILQGLPKSDKMELIIQKCTELGVKEITPILMTRCIVKIDEKEASKKQERWQKIAEVAAKQCGRELIPKINPVHTLKNIYKLIEEYDILLVAYEKEEANTLKPIIEELKSKNKNDLKIAILIGPEGGIDEKEIKELKTGEVITLGKRILRTETVAFVLSSILMYELRRFGIIGGIK